MANTPANLQLLAGSYNFAPCLIVVLSITALAVKKYKGKQCLKLNYELCMISFNFFFRYDHALHAYLFHSPTKGMAKQLFQY